MTEQAALHIPDELPILPLIGTVVYPLTVTPLAVSQEHAVRLIDMVLGGDGLVGLLARRDERARPGPAGLDACFPVGTVARIHRLLRLPDGALRVAAEGIERIEVIGPVQQEPVLRAAVRAAPDLGDPSSEMLIQNVAARADELLSLLPGTATDLRAQILTERDPRRLSFLVAQAVLIRRNLAERHDILVLRDTTARLERLIDLIERELVAMRRMTPATARQEWAAPPVPLVGSAHTLEEVTDPHTNEIAPPRGRRTDELFDLELAREAFLDGVVGMAEASQVLLELLAARELRRQRGTDHMPFQDTVCLIAPAGGGKSTLARAAARAAGLPYVRVALPTVASADDLLGRPGSPGAMLRALARSGVENPLIELDGVDRIEPSVAVALLSLLDGECRGEFYDRALGSWDLRGALLVVSARDGSALHPALAEQLLPLDLPLLTPEERLDVARRFLLPQLAEAHGLLPEELSVDLTTLVELVQSTDGEPGLTSLEHALAALCRKAALRVFEK
jgi:ATP-dependent Lon protease